MLCYNIKVKPQGRVGSAKLTDRMRGQDAAYVTDALMSAARPVSAYDLMAAIRPRIELTSPTVYRAFRHLVAVGKARRIESLYAFVACQHRQCAETAHRQGDGSRFSVCDRCRSLDEVIDPVVGERVVTTRVGRGISDFIKTLQVRPVCAICNEKAVV